MRRSSTEESESVSRPRSPLAKAPPSDDALTDYDEQHFAIYLGLLHARAEGATDAEMCRNILGIDPDLDPEWARAVLQSHLDRAHWLSTSGRGRILES